MKYSKKKFKSFSLEKRIKIFLEFIREIEENWHDENLRFELLDNFLDCINYAEKELKIPELQSFSEIILKDSNNKKMTLREFLNYSIPFEQKYKNVKDNDFLVLKKDGTNVFRNKIPLYLILDNLRSSFNIGSIFRTAECLGISEILLCGYSATPKNIKVQKTAMGTEKYVDWKYLEKTEDAILYLRNKNMKIFALETTTNSKSIYEVEFPQKCALILGNEALGIPEKILNLTDEIINIPISGWKNSMNVGVCFAVVAFEIKRQWK
ncbi:MAG: RNA methyltransferase [Candidatus Cloacimonetes bacterium]|nr:RNA methyltransferase [Candidatus Cloacimonadota bacterium]